MNANKRRELHETATLAAMVALSHLKASNQGDNGASCNVALIYIKKSAAACLELAMAHQCLIDPNTMSQPSKETNEKSKTKV